MDEIRRISVAAIFSVALAAGAFAQQSVPADLVITLERTQCFGHCPAYSLRLRANRNFEIISAKLSTDGKVAAPIKGNIPNERLGELLAEFRKIRFYSLLNQYGKAGTGKGKGGVCPQVSTDYPTAIVSLTENGRHKNVSHYLGCEGSAILYQLVALEDKIDDVVGTKRWEKELLTGVADVIDLKLEVVPAKSAKPKDHR